MKDPRVVKLRKVYKGILDDEQVSALVEQGLDSPRKIKAAKRADLQRVPLIGAATANRLKEKRG